MPSAPVLVTLAVVAMLITAGRPVAHGVKKAAVKTKHAIVHVVTLGKR
jgi:hypothetical protein